MNTARISILEHLDDDQLRELRVAVEQKLVEAEEQSYCWSSREDLDEDGNCTDPDCEYMKMAPIISALEAELKCLDVEAFLRLYPSGYFRVQPGGPVPYEMPINPEGLTRSTSRGHLYVEYETRDEDGWLVKEGLFLDKDTFVPLPEDS